MEGEKKVHKTGYEEADINLQSLIFSDFCLMSTIREWTGDSL